jgi:ATP adenylyltransferase/5',5'''-P-1,P-4-tetraphosphate phosphorylase II
MKRIKKGDIFICIKERPDAEFKLGKTYTLDFNHSGYCGMIINKSTSVGFALKRENEFFNSTHFILEDHFILLKESRKLKIDEINKKCH